MEQRRIAGVGLVAATAERAKSHRIGVGMTTQHEINEFGKRLAEEFRPEKVVLLPDDGQVSPF